jgi:oxygen-independent coproporphyrinogen-3 oxidase
VFGIYIHIPFCRKACIYCDFHFSTRLESRGEVMDALCREIALRKEETRDWGTPSTLYFGGGTPSVLTSGELDALFGALDHAFPRTVWDEVTLEANPEDITPEVLAVWQDRGITRLSIGIQTFDDTLLSWMNRSHSGKQAEEAVQAARAAGFKRLSADLIYGLPGRSEADWATDVDRVLALPVSHLSAYVLTVEPRTALGHRVERGEEFPAPDEAVLRSYALLTERARRAGADHYEVSNFALAGGERAVHNAAYWRGIRYLGIGPGAHGFTGTHRYANVSNNRKYVTAVRAGILPESREALSLQDRYNERIMTGLRTAEGIEPEALEAEFALRPDVEEAAAWKRALDRGELVPGGRVGAWRVAEASWMIGDSIASRFFRVD